MKYRNKHTIVLCLASLVTVLGAFSSDLYNNHLVMLKIEKSLNSSINVTAYTEKLTETKLQKFQIDANTHVIILPETDSSKDIMPEIADCPNVTSVDIKTFPYTKEQAGYTKVTIKTNTASQIEAQTMLYLTDIKSPPKQLESQKSYWDFQNTSPTVENEPAKTQQKSENIVHEKAVQSINNEQILPAEERVKPNKIPDTSSNNEPLAMILCGSILLMIIGFILLIGKDKMASIVGDQNKIDLSSDDDEKNKKQKNLKNIKRTINSLDKRYSNSQLKKAKDLVTESKDEQSKQEEEPIEVINLDEIYNSTQNSATVHNDNVEETDDLADFLNEFNFTEEEPEDKEEAFDEEFYQNVINQKNLTFTREDVDKLDNLLRLEISGDMQSDLSEYLQKKKSAPKPLTKKQMLEDFVLSYSINQNITFSQNDINILKDLMSVELDKDFVTNLRTNPERLKEMNKELASKRMSKPKSMEVLTLNVKDLLPDLSKELKKQGNKGFSEPEARRDVVYYTEGYEYTKLSVSDDLSDIKSALQTKDATIHKESYSAPIVETGYDVSTMTTDFDLPDLADVLAHPEKYEEKKASKFEANENTLLNSLANVTFKPFYEDENKDPVLYDNLEDVDDSMQDLTPNEITDSAETFQEPVSNIKIDAQNLSTTIKEQKLPDVSTVNIMSKPAKNKHINEAENGIIKTILINKNAECSLVKTDSGYDVIGYVDDKPFNLKHYNALRVTNMQIRVHEKDKQYLVKLGIHKFVINITEDSMEFVMDLC